MVFWDRVRIISRGEIQELNRIETENDGETQE